LQSQIMNLLIRIQAELSLTYLVISHDLNVIRYVCDDVAVMYLGKIVELAEAPALFAAPRHPYTQGLMAAIPRPGWSVSDQRPLQGDLPDPFSPPSGCRFHPRCQWATKICRTTQPELRVLGPGHVAACHRAEEIEGADLAESDVERKALPG
jgi:oligopeptide/dipeptide ABC transporter ATP-binding protein